MEPLKRATAALKTAVRTLSPNCREASRLQSAALDRPLRFWKWFGLRIHRRLGRWCRRYGQQIRILREAAHEHSDEVANAAPDRLSPEARERLKQALRNGPK